MYVKYNNNCFPIENFICYKSDFSIIFVSLITSKQKFHPSFEEWNL